MTRTTRDIPHARCRRWLRLAIGLLLGSQSGCSREFYRNWANQDATEGIFEKSRDPRWRLDLYSAEPPALSRFANPYDPDFPPAPPDDPASEFLSPVPQNPKFRLMVPMEGTGYVQMLEQFRRDRPYRPERRTDPKTGTAGSAERVPAGEPPEEPSPFLPTSPDNAIEGDIMGPDSATNSGTPPQAMTPNRSARRSPVAQAPSSAPSRRPSPSSKDSGVLLAAYQEANIPPPADVPSPVEMTPEEAAARARQGRPLQDPPAVDNDPYPGVQVTPEGDRGAGLASTPEGERLERYLTEPVPFGRREEILAAGLPEGSDPYIVTPRDALELALVNSRVYQFRMEGLLLTALPVTLQRFAFEPQFYAGLNPNTGVGGNGLGNVLGGGGPTIPPPNGVNQYQYRTKEGPGGSLSLLNLGTAAGVGKLFNSGLRIAGGIANTTIFNFSGSSPRQPTVQSALPVVLSQPFLRGGGRAVTLEPLTQAERNLLYEVRAFARFRQEFFVNILGGANQGFTTSTPITGGVNPTDPSVGYLNLVQQLQEIENDQKNVVAFERVLKVYLGLSEGAGSNISSLDVDQIDRSLQTQRSTLLQDSIQYRNLLDQYKQQLGLPPDLPMIPDYAVMSAFSDTFAAIDALVPKQRKDLERLVSELPPLPDVLIDGRSVLRVVREDVEKTELLEDILLAAERVALENRLDLMNQRAQLYDTWRQIRVTHNALQGVFNLTLTNQIFTPSTTANPFAFLDQSKQFSLVVNAELPLVRVNERNNFRLALVNYERQRRNLMASEDTIKFQVRQGVRNLLQFYKLYEIQKRGFLASLRAADLSLQNLLGPAQAGGGGGGGGQGGTQTNVYAQQQQGILTSENQLVLNWVNYHTNRFALIRDLGIAPYDEWEAFYEFFPAAAQYDRADAPGIPGPAAPAAALGGAGGWWPEPFAPVAAP